MQEQDDAERQRLEAIARWHQYVLRPCRNISPGVMIPERDVAKFPKMRDYFLSEEVAITLIRVTVGSDGFIVVPLELIG